MHKLLVSFMILLTLERLSAEELIEERLANGLGKASLRPWALNPADIPLQGSQLSLLQVQGSSGFEAIQNPSSTNPQELSHQRQQNTLLVSYLGALSGGAWNLQLADAREQVLSKRGVMREPLEESFRTRDYKVSLVFDLGSGLRGGLGIRYLVDQGRFYGSFGLSPNDHSSFRARSFGYNFGLRQELGAWQLGVFSQPPIRGQTTLSSEAKVISRPGFAGAQVQMSLQEQWQLGLLGLQWFYKKDERDEIGRTPINQRAILQRGIGLDSYLRQRKRLTLSSEYSWQNQFIVKAIAAQHQASFLFDASRLPGEKQNLETLQSYRTYQLAAIYQGQQILLELSWLRSDAELKNERAKVNEMNLQELGAPRLRREERSLGLNWLF